MQQKTLYAMRDNASGMFGYSDCFGHFVIDAIYDFVRDFSDGLGWVSVGKYRGFINYLGQFVINPLYEYVGDFEDGVTDFYESGLCGIMNNKGSVVLPAVYDSAWVVNHNLFIVGKDNKVGLINGSGNHVIDFKYDEMHGFDEKGWCHVIEKGRSKYINGEGVVLLDMGLLNSESFFHDLAKFVEPGGCGIIDRNGDVVIQARYDNAMIANDSLIWVNSDGKWALIDDKSNVRVDFQYDEVMPFENGYAGVSVKGKWGYINEKFDSVTGYIFDDVGCFNKEGTVRVIIGDEWQYIGAKTGIRPKVQS